MFVPTILLRDNEAPIEVTDILFACLVGMATTKSVEPESIGNPVNMGKECQHSPGNPFKLL